MTVENSDEKNKIVGSNISKKRKRSDNIMKSEKKNKKNGSESDYEPSETESSEYSSDNSSVADSEDSSDISSDSESCSESNDDSESEKEHKELKRPVRKATIGKKYKEESDTESDTESDKSTSKKRKLNSISSERLSHQDSNVTIEIKDIDIKDIEIKDIDISSNKEIKSTSDIIKELKSTALDDIKNDYKDLEDEAEKEYQKYVEKLVKNLGSNILNTIKNKEDESSDDNKKPQIGQLLIVGGISNKPKQRVPIKRNDYNDLTFAEKRKIRQVEKELKELNKHNILPRNKILLADISIASKAKILSNMDRLKNMNSYSSEYSKLTRWIDNVLKIPFGKYYDLPISLSSPNHHIESYLSDVESVMNKCIYGQNMAKEKILEFVGKWITNPNTTNEPLAFIGEKGTGKTTLAKEGISKALGRPFFMISLGGESDAASFKGHDYTYEGSRWGRVVDILIATQCMNPVIFFDELDKVSTTRAGEEITGMLMHLTDTTQNDKFSDKYFSGIDFDFSKALFIFSYNHPEKLNPILRDRLTEIKFTSFNKKEKLIIAKDFLIKRACENIGLSINNYQLNDDIIMNLINNYTQTEDSGVRKLKRVIETLFLRLNLHQLPQKLNISYKNMKIKKKNGKLIIDEKVIKELLKDMVKTIPKAVLSMYS